MGVFICVSNMALISLVKVQSRVFNAKCSEPQVGISNGVDGASCIIKKWMLKIENTSEYNKTTDWQVSKNLIIQRGIYNEV